jgi:hypothetical protein
MAGLACSWNHGPDEYHNGLKHNATVEAYQSCALQEGIPDRPHGLFPPDDAFLTSLARTRGLVPFQVPTHSLSQCPAHLPPCFTLLTEVSGIRPNSTEVSDRRLGSV